MVELIGGPWDGHRQEHPDDLPREDCGTWMLLPDRMPWPDDVPEGCAPRAMYDADPEPAPADRWHYRGLTYL